jgi:hypothetical protein
VGPYKARGLKCHRTPGLLVTRLRWDLVSPLMKELIMNSNYHNIYHVISDTIAMGEEESHYSLFVLALSSPPASHNKENKRNPTLVLIAPV